MRGPCTYRGRPYTCMADIVADGEGAGPVPLAEPPEQQQQRHQQQQPPKNPNNSLIAGAAGGTAAVLLLHPFDFLKVRLQGRAGCPALLGLALGPGEPRAPWWGWGQEPCGRADVHHQQLGA